MPSRYIRFAPGEYYHLYNRGAGQQAIFREADNYLLVLRKVKHYAASYGIAIIAYCLMPNHYHFLVRQEDDVAAGLLLQHVFNGYTKAFNKRYERSGTLFEDRFQAIHVDKESYLIHLCRYIHLNPVKAGLAADPAAWPYSNYLEWIGERSGTLVDHQFIRDRFSHVADYRQFVYDYLVGRSVPPAGIEAYLLEGNASM